MYAPNPKRRLGLPVANHLHETLIFEECTIPVPPGATFLWFADPYREALPINGQNSLTVSIPVDAEVTYGFQTDSTVTSDPHNSDGAGPQCSILSGGKVDRTLWPPRKSETPVQLPGKRVSLDRNILNRRCTLRFDDRDSEFSVFFLDGDDWIFLHDLTSALDLAVKSGFLPEVNRIFIPAAKDRQSEYVSEEFALAVIEHLIPKFGTSHNILVGQSLGGLAAIRAGLLSSNLSLQAIIAQSPALWWQPSAPGSMTSDDHIGGFVDQYLRDHQAFNTHPYFFLTCGREEPHMQKHVEQVANTLLKQGYRVSYQLAPGGHDASMWRHGLISCLQRAIVTQR